MSDDQIKVTTSSIKDFISKLQNLSDTIDGDASVKTLSSFGNKDTTLLAGWHDSKLESVGAFEDAFGQFANRMATTVTSINKDILQLQNNLAAVQSEFDITDDNATWTASEVQALFTGFGSSSAS